MTQDTETSEVAAELLSTADLVGLIEQKSLQSITARREQGNVVVMEGVYHDTGLEIDIPCLFVAQINKGSNRGVLIAIELNQGVTRVLRSEPSGARPEVVHNVLKGFKDSEPARWEFQGAAHSFASHIR